jgi:PhnB protein
MKKLYPYIAFSGNCEEALNFYKDALGGEIRSLMRYSEAPEYATEENKNLIMHSEFVAEGIRFMAADEMKPRDNATGRVSLSIDFDTAEEEEKVFNALSDGANIMMPLQDTFWGARFGILADKFGISWMFNYDKP